MSTTMSKVNQSKDSLLYPEIEYFGITGDDEFSVFKTLWPDGEPELLPLEPSLKLRDHSPDGFCWGYNGSGPAQLALALLLDAINIPETAVYHHQQFKNVFVAKWDTDNDWSIFRSEIIRWLELHRTSEENRGRS